MGTWLAAGKEGDEFWKLSCIVVYFCQMRELRMLLGFEYGNLKNDIIEFIFPILTFLFIVKTLFHSRQKDGIEMGAER